MKKDRFADSIMKLMKFIPPIISAVLIVVTLMYLSANGIDYQKLVVYAPKNTFLAVAVILLMYAFKSLSVVFPLTALFVATGIIFPLWLAMPLNIVGLTISFTIPYLLGRFSGKELIVKIVGKYPKAKKLYELEQSNDIFISFLTRAMAVVPGDIVSMLLGASDVKYPNYLLGSQLGLLPGMILQTLIGAFLGEDIKPWMIVLFAAMMIVCGAVSIVANRMQKMKTNTPE